MLCGGASCVHRAAKRLQQAADGTYASHLLRAEETRRRERKIRAETERRRRYVTLCTGCRGRRCRGRSWGQRPVTRATCAVSR